MNNRWTDIKTRWATALALAVSIAILTHSALAAESAGTILLAKGDAEVEGADGRVKELEKGTEVVEGDTIRTATKSFAVIRFTDGGKVTVRPKSVLVIDKYAYGSDNDGSTLDLIKGGLRALTGAIAKNNPDAYRVNTPVATLGVRGTEFDVRLCEAECEGEEPGDREAARSAG